MSRTVLVCVFVNLIDCGARRILIVFTKKILTHLIGMVTYLHMGWNGITDVRKAKDVLLFVFKL